MSVSRLRLPLGLSVASLASCASLCLAAAACSSSSTTPAPDSRAANGDAGGVSGSGAVAGTYGADPIKPIVAAYWVGQPGDQSESGGGPFIYLFSTAVSCDDLAKASGWAPSLPAGTQATELIVGVITTGTPAAASAHAGAGVAEINYFGQSSTESRATGGSVSLTAYVKDVSVDGTLDVMFPSGTAKGSFHAVWCPGGHER